jgi:hypothetical protein
MVPSYKGDFSRAKLLVESFNQFCRDDMELRIVVPESDFSLFSSLQSEKVKLVTDDSIPVRFATESLHGARPGYINQEIIKLAFWKLGVFENYLCLDSDGVFIRDFDSSDFMFSENEPFTVMFDDKELMCNPEYREMWIEREAKIRKIYEIYEITQPKYIRTCHGFQIFNREVLHEMELEFMKPRNLDYLNLMEISPYEFSWYTLYLVKRDKAIHQTEQFFKLYHNATQFLSDVILGIDASILANGYVGLIVNSNFQPHNRLVDVNSNKRQVLASYSSSADLLVSLLIKFKFLPMFLKIQAYNGLVSPLKHLVSSKKK